MLGSPSPLQPAGVTETSEPAMPDWPWSAEGRRRQRRSAMERTIDLGDGVQLSLVRVPAGRFVIGSRRSLVNSRPRPSRLIKPFWIGRSKSPTSNSVASIRITTAGGADARLPVRHPRLSGRQARQPAVRLSWNDAMAFCDWLSAHRQAVSLPTEAQWEYACRAGSKHRSGTATSTRIFPVSQTWVMPARASSHWTLMFRSNSSNPNRYDDWVPKEDASTTADWSRCRWAVTLANPWGLYDMHGNVCEWTLSAYRPYPYWETMAATSDPTRAACCPRRFLVRPPNAARRPSDSPMSPFSPSSMSVSAWSCGRELMMSTSLYSSNSAFHSGWACS